MPTRLRIEGKGNARGGSLCERDLLIMHAWAAPEIQSAWSGGSSSRSRKGGSKLGSKIRASGERSKGAKRARPRKRPSGGGGVPKEAPPLPPGWREETRTPQSGRKYRVYLGPVQGLYAESRNKAWETYERLEREANGEPEPEYEEGPGKKRKGAKRICLACDFGRKRKCTCGKRARRW